MMAKKLASAAKKAANRYAVVSLVNSKRGYDVKKTILVRAVENRILEQDDRIVEAVFETDPILIRSAIDYIDFEWEQILREDALDAAKKQFGNPDDVYQAVHDQVELVKNRLEKVQSVRGGVNVAATI